MKTLKVLIALLVFLIGANFLAAKKVRKAQFVPYQKIYAHELCKNSDFRCVVVQKNISWEKFWSDKTERELIMKLNRQNGKLLKSQMTVAIPKNMAGKVLMDFSPFPKKIQYTPQMPLPGADPRHTFEYKEIVREKFVVFDPALLAWGAYDKDGNLIRWGPALGGQDYCRDTHRACRTVTGIFRVGLKGNVNSRSGAYPIGCGSKRKPCAPMPWIMYFHKHLYGIHGSTQMIGYNASHGCVRTFIDDAEWLNKNFVDLGTMVIVKSYPHSLKKWKSKK